MNRVLSQHYIKDGHNVSITLQLIEAHSPLLQYFNRA